MWKEGVTAPGPLMQRALATRAPRRFALTLLAGNEAALRVMDEILLSRLYDELVVAGKIHKTTRRNRFKGLDQEILRLMQTHFAAESTLRVHDVGASSGITSLELWRTLAAWHDTRVHASDYYACLLVVRFADAPWATVCTEDGEPLQFVSERFVLRVTEAESVTRPVNRWLQRRARQLLPQVREILKADAAGAALPAGSSIERIRLWHPECVLACAREPRFTLGRHDIFTPQTPQWHFVRAMNVLNPGYFSVDAQRRAAHALAAGLLPGGILLVGRTREEADATTAASFFVKQNGRLRLLLDLRGGAENRDLILDAEGADGFASSSPTPELP